MPMRGVRSIRRSGSGPTIEAVLAEAFEGLQRTLAMSAF